MKKLIVATFALVAAAPFAASADSFSGAYAGVGLDLNVLTSQNTVNDNRLGAGLANYTQRDSAGGTLWGGALYGGWGKCFNQFYVGAELGLDLQGGHVKTTGTDFGVISSRSMKVSRGFSVSPTVRLGYVIAPKTLAFFKLGTAATSFKQEFTSTINGIVTPSVTVKKNHTLWGFTMGAGMETCISSRMKLRAEYIRTMYPTAKVSNGVALVANNGPTSTKIKPVDNIFRIGVAYSF